jgi:DNA-binding response OmpR family regulator
LKVLVIEDEQRVASFIRKGLEEHNIQVAQAFDGATGLKLALGETSMIVLDV